MIMENNEKKVATIFDYARMCGSLSCCKCPLSSRYNGCDVTCYTFIKDFPEEANDMIIVWIEEEEKKNKVKTYADDFFEKFPKAEREDDGSPHTCIKYIHPELKDKIRCYYQPCAECWNLPYSSPEEAEKALKEMEK